VDATLIIVENDAELARAQDLVAQLMPSMKPTDHARLEAQARLIAAYEERKWPQRRATPAEIIAYLMDQHDLTRADMVPILGTASRVSEVLSGKKRLSLAMIQRLRARFRVPADVFIPEAVKRSKPRRAARRRARSAA
jgi:HTH-type transcriptional regulator/antitoxin HigA